MTSEAKLTGFQAGRGITLFFEYTQKIKERQESRLLHADKIPMSALALQDRLFITS
jgi:predicted oxidoreductase (fatty acid repression mutant protein)